MNICLVYLAGAPEGNGALSARQIAIEPPRRMAMPAAPSDAEGHRKPTASAPGGILGRNPKRQRTLRQVGRWNASNMGHR